ncbi:MAG: hypothetical protein KDB32_10510 [Planctomycetes bacterium]|nr:hypothetical protein [Planctomycetota bacterium]
MTKIVCMLLLTTFAWALSQPVAFAQREAKAQEPVKTAKLPAPAEDVKLARNGDLLIAKLQGKKLLAIVDVKAGKLTKTIKTSTADCIFAAGGEKAVVYDATASVFTTYSLSDGKRLKAKKSPFTGVVCSMVMGSNNDKFALLRVAANTDALASVEYARLDLETLNGESLEGRPHNSSYRDAEQMRLSADGTFFCAWATSHSPTGQIVGTVSETAIELQYEHNSVGHILPIPGKHLAVTGNGSVLTSANRVVKSHGGVSLYPDGTGAFYVGVNGQQVHVYATGSHQLFNTLNIPLPLDRWGRSTSVVFPLSNHKVLATLSTGRDAFQFYAFDPIGDLENSDLDYLLVLSSPPTQLEAGTTFEYTPEIATNAKSWSLESLDAPEDAKISDQKITWNAPKDAVGEEFEFLLRVTTDNDDEVFLDFKIKVVAKSEEKE